MVARRGRLRAQKSPPGNRRAFRERGFAAALCDRFGDRDVKFDGVRVIAFYPVQLVASLQHAIEFIDQHGNCLVTFVRLNGRIHIWALDLDMTFGLELHPGGGIAITFQLDAHPNDALLVTKQSLGLLADKRLERRCQFEVNAGDD